jgi:hypothetical protein
MRCWGRGFPPGPGPGTPRRPEAGRGRGREGEGGRVVAWRRWRGGGGGLSLSLSLSLCLALAHQQVSHYALAALRLRTSLNSKQQLGTQQSTKNKARSREPGGGRWVVHGVVIYPTSGIWHLPEASTTCWLLAAGVDCLRPGIPCTCVSP